MCSFKGGGPALGEKICVHPCSQGLKWSLPLVEVCCLSFAFVFLNVDLICLPVVVRQCHLPVDHLSLGVYFSCTGKCNYRPATQGQHNSWEGAQGTEEMEARYGSLKDEYTIRKKKTYSFGNTESRRRKH